MANLDADCAAGGRADRGGAHPAARDRSGACGPAGSAALFGVQPAHHAGAERDGRHGVGGRVGGPEDGSHVLHGPDWDPGRGAGAAWWFEACARDAGGELHSDARADRAVLFDQASDRSGPQSLPGEMSKGKGVVSTPPATLGEDQRWASPYRPGIPAEVLQSRCPQHLRMELILSLSIAL